MTQKKIVYRPHSLEKIITINDWEFDLIIVSSHFEEEHGSYMSDELILKIVQQLDKKSGFIPKLQGQLPDGTEWQSFFWEPFCHDKKAYRLVWYWEIQSIVGDQINIPRLWILNCHRRSKYDKKC